jgi:mannose-6-phosphate isomerase-like protein (cupin superfamily)
MTDATALRTEVPPFPGGTSLSHLRVYDWAAPDGAGRCGGGSPHLHTASSEGYLVLTGAGSVQTLGPQGFAQTPLAAGALVWFTPGVVHRLVNDGGLQILVVMSHAGLPEAGDAVLTFPADVLADVGAYRQAAALPTQQPGRGTAGEDDEVVAAAARARRDLALEGFATLRRRVEREGPGALVDLYAAAGRLVADLAPRWHQIWAATVPDQSVATARVLADLALGNAPHLARAAVGAASVRPGPRGYGMCGRLQTWAQ